MMYFIFVIVMGLILGWLAVPAMRQLGYSYGRFGRSVDWTLVVLGAIVLGVIFALITGMTALAESGVVIGLVVGGIGALVVIILLTVLSAASATREERGSANPEADV